MIKKFLKEFLEIVFFCICLTFYIFLANLANAKPHIRFKKTNSIARHITPNDARLSYATTALAIAHSKSADASTRPNWSNRYVKEYDCYMNTRTYLLWKNAVIVEVKKSGSFCKIKKGLWMVLNDDKFNYKKTDNVKEIEIDHIIPWSYLKKHIQQEDYNTVFNLTLNLIPVSKKYNRNKSDKICHNELICKKQQDVCELLKVILDIQGIKNTINCEYDFF